MKASDTPHSLFSSAKRFMQGTALSRISGLVREMAMAYIFGASPSVGAFYVAFRLANFFRRFFAEGAMLCGIVPHYEKLRQEGVEKASAFVRDLSGTIVLFFLPFLLILEVGLYFCAQSSSSREISLLTMTMIPGLLFLSLHTVATALAQCHQKYFLSSLSPVALNLVWILAIVFLRGVDPHQAMPWLAWGILLGYILQWLVVWPQAWSLAVKGSQSFVFFSPTVKQMLPAFTLSLIGVGAVQINGAIDVFFARWASLEGPAYLNYALRLQQLPLGLFSIAIASALLPPLTRAKQEGNERRFSALIGFACERGAMLILPCSIGCILFGIPLVQLFYGHGSFDAAAMSGTVLCLWGYGVGLLPMSFAILLQPVFYSYGDYRTPTVACVISVVVNLLCNALCIFYWRMGPESVAFATSVAATVQVGVLWFSLGKVVRKGFLLLWPAVRVFLFCVPGIVFVIVGSPVLFHEPACGLQGSFTPGFVKPFLRCVFGGCCLLVPYVGLLTLYSSNFKKRIRFFPSSA